MDWCKGKKKARSVSRQLQSTGNGLSTLALMLCLHAAWSCYKTYSTRKYCMKEQLVRYLKCILEGKPVLNQLTWKGCSLCSLYGNVIPLLLK